MPNKQKWTMHHAQNLAIRITLIFSTKKKNNSNNNNNSSINFKLYYWINFL